MEMNGCLSTRPASADVICSVLGCSPWPVDAGLPPVQRLSVSWGSTCWRHWWSRVSTTCDLCTCRGDGRGWGAARTGIACLVGHCVLPPHPSSPLFVLYSFLFLLLLLFSGCMRGLPASSARDCLWAYHITPQTSLLSARVQSIVLAIFANGGELLDGHTSCGSERSAAADCPGPPHPARDSAGHRRGRLWMGCWVMRPSLLKWARLSACCGAFRKRSRDFASQPP